MTTQKRRDRLENVVEVETQEAYDFAEAGANRAFHLRLPSELGEEGVEIRLL